MDHCATTRCHLKRPEPYDDFNPSSAVNIKPCRALKGRSALRVLSSIVPQFQRIFPDFELEIATE